MQKILSIQLSTNYTLLCIFNDGAKRVLNILPIIESHKNIKGVEKLIDPEVFSQVKIGELGQIYWEKIVQDSDNNLLDYYISPEYVYVQGAKI